MDKRIVDLMVRYEEEDDFTKYEFFDLFSYLIKNGDAWKLQGFYGRTAWDLIENEFIDKDGNVLVNIDEIDLY